MENEKLRMKDFEAFVEKLKAFIDNIDLDGYPISQYDLRMPDLDGLNNNIYSIPQTIKDYAEIWQDIAEIRENITDYYVKVFGNHIFLDVYWNDTKENYADYIGDSFFVYFKENGEFAYDNKQNDKPKKVAKLVTFEIKTRVVVNKNQMPECEEEDAINKAMEKINRDGIDGHLCFENCTEVYDDTECPYGTFIDEN